MRAGWLPKVPLFFAVAALFSCAGGAKPTIVSPPDYSTMKIEELGTMAVKDPERCLEAVSALSYAEAQDPQRLPSESISSKELVTLAELSLGVLVGDFDTALANRKWLEAARYFDSLSTLKSPGALDFLPPDGRDGALAKIGNRAGRDNRFSIYLGLAEEYKVKGLYAPAIQYYKSALDSFLDTGSEQKGNSGALSASASATVAEWSNWARTNGDSSTSDYLDRISSVGAKAGEASKNSIPSMVSGVVTVYVDKGLKIENGYGVPDRVLGTAFQIDGSGVYLTNYHVVQSEVDTTYKGYSSLSVRPSATPEARIPAKVLGWDKDLDLALIQTSEKANFTFRIPDKDTISNGQTVFAIGSPVGLENSVSSGIISATGRHFLSLGDAIQIDVPVNPGNSGSPLVDAGGKLQGIVFAGLPNFQGINFALPVSWIRKDIPFLFQGGEVKHTWLGLLLTKTIDGKLKVVYRYPGTGNAFEPGDTLLSIDSMPVMDIQTIQAYLAFKQPKSLCMVEVRRNGVVRYILRRILPEFQSSFEAALPNDDAENILEGCGGMLVQNISLPHGPGGIYKVIEAWPGMAADESGILAGDVFKFLSFSVDKASEAIYLDLSVKSRMTGYLERAMRIAVPLTMTNFI